MEKQKVVADALIVAKWFLDEEFSKEARLLRDSFVKEELTISVPNLLFYEILNALRYTGVYNFEELADAARSLSKYGFDVWEPKGNILEETAKMSLKHNISIYDAAYVALASHLSAILYTADVELIEKAPQYAKHVKDLPA